MNKALITLSIFASLGVSLGVSLGAAAAITSLTSAVVNAEEIVPVPKVDQPVADVQAVVQAVVQDDCSIQIWPNFSQSCLRGRDTHLTVRNVSVITIERR